MHFAALTIKIHAKNTNTDAEIEALSDKVDEIFDKLIAYAQQLAADVRTDTLTVDADY